MGPWKWFNLQDDPLIAGLDTELMAMLDMARDKAGVPFTITSGKRSPDQNAALCGAVQDSAHLAGLAVDLAVPGDDHVFDRMLYGLTIAGFVRKGQYFSVQGAKLIPRHLHIDIDKTKPQEVTWSLVEEN